MGDTLFALPLVRYGLRAQAHRTKPMARLDCADLVPILRGRPVVAITDDSAAIKTASGGLLTFRRHESSPTERCLIWELAAPEMEVQ